MILNMEEDMHKLKTVSTNLEKTVLKLKTMHTPAASNRDTEEAALPRGAQQCLSALRRMVAAVERRSELAENQQQQQQQRRGGGGGGRGSTTALAPLPTLFKLYNSRLYKRKSGGAGKDASGSGAAGRKRGAQAMSSSAAGAAAGRRGPRTGQSWVGDYDDPTSFRCEHSGADGGGDGCVAHVSGERLMFSCGRCQGWFHVACEDLLAH